MDLTKLYFAVKDLRLRVDYKSLIEFVKEEYPEVDEEDIKFEAYTLYNPQNNGQVKFIERLEAMGVSVTKNTFDKSANFSIDIAARAASNRDKQILVISNDPDLARLFSILRGTEKEPTLCFFSERLGNTFYPDILSGDVDFIDLSHPEVKNIIAGSGENTFHEYRG